MKLTVYSILVSAFIALTLAETFSASPDGELLGQYDDDQHERYVRSYQGPSGGYRGGISRPTPSPTFPRPPQGRYIRSYQGPGSRILRPTPTFPRPPPGRVLRSIHPGPKPHPSPTFPRPPVRASRYKRAAEVRFVNKPPQRHRPITYVQPRRINLGG